uniref:ShKT domain-containing protein n=1 Tax=Globodera rostochiensis TaxID=31243 RepID=A0A914HHW2_GLORO
MTTSFTTVSMMASTLTPNLSCCCVCKECNGTETIKRSVRSAVSDSSSDESSSSSEEKADGCEGKNSDDCTTRPPKKKKTKSKHWGSTTPSPTPPPPKNRVCHDNHECCMHWAAKGGCKSAPRTMNTWCPGTCRFNGCRPHAKQGTPGCKNLYSECKRWAHYHENDDDDHNTLLHGGGSKPSSMNECERNPHWMAQNCAKACKKCGRLTTPEQCAQKMPTDYVPTMINDD